MFGVMLTILVNVLIIKYSGNPVPAPDIPRSKISIGSGEKLNYAIFGDSTSVSQGSDYSEGYAVKTAEKLAETRQITHQNFGVSGARIADVVYDQVPKSYDFKPDIALIAVGANDVTHFTGFQEVEKGTNKIIDDLRLINPSVKIVITGSAAMGSVTRFPEPTKSIMAWRTNRVNQIMERVSKDKNVVFAYIAKETGDQFKKHPEYFASDKFHPNNEGYLIWTRVLNSVLEEVIKQ